MPNAARMHSSARRDISSIVRFTSIWPIRSAIAILKKILRLNSESSRAASARVSTALEVASHLG